MRRTGVWISALVAAACLWAAALQAAPCAPGTTTLCLSGGRFEVQVSWKDFQDRTGSGQAVALTPDTGYFWFFSASNVELIVKVLDARALNGHFWVFYGALSNVEYELTVRDTQTSDIQIYANPAGQFGSAGDTLAFPPDSGSLERATSSRAMGPAGTPIDESAILPAAWESQAACSPGATALCLSGGRFRVEAAWKDFGGKTGAGQAVGLTGDTGYFWFFSSTNVEAVIKVLDARVLNDHFWVFYGALSNVEYTLTVTDTVTGIVRTYSNPSSLFASVGDTLAFGKPTTLQLIDGAVVKGEIDSDTALLYKVYAFFGDARLPQAYAGEPPGLEEHGILFEVSDRWANARERRAALRADWTRIETTRAAVWYRAADAGAATAASNVAAEIEYVWSQEKALFGHEPKTDAGRTSNGGDGKLDLYLLPSFRDPRHTGAGGVTVPYSDQDSSQPRAVYILIRLESASTVPGARATVAHEFFHAIAATYNNGFNGWLNEATATWMEDHVYPTGILNMEHVAAGGYLTSGYKTPYDQPADPYHDYLFLFYLARKFNPGLNRDIWNNLVGKSALDAIDAAIPGGFEQRWPEFALYCWDQPDVDQFDKWDQISSGLVAAAAEPYLPIQSPNPDGVDLPAHYAPPLAMRYAYVEVLTEDVKRLEIKVPTNGGNANAKTQAWIKLADGTTRVEDWSEKSKAVFCRDKASQNVTKLLILHTNSAKRKPAVWGPGKVIADPIACGGFEGTARATQHSVDPPNNGDQTMDVTARFLQDPDPNHPERYYLARITMRFSMRQYYGGAGCTFYVDPTTKSDSFGPSHPRHLIVLDKSTQPPGYQAYGSYDFIATVKEKCDDGRVGEPSPSDVGGDWFNVPEEAHLKANPDGSLTGTYTETFGGTTRRWVWNFQPAGE